MGTVALHTGLGCGWNTHKNEKGNKRNGEMKGYKSKLG